MSKNQNLVHFEDGTEDQATEPQKKKNELHKGISCFEKWPIKFRMKNLKQKPNEKVIGSEVK